MYTSTLSSNYQLPSIYIIIFIIKLTINIPMITYNYCISKLVDGKLCRR